MLNTATAQPDIEQTRSRNKHTFLERNNDTMNDNELKIELLDREREHGRLLAESENVDGLITRTLEDAIARGANLDYVTDAGLPFLHLRPLEGVCGDFRGEPT